MWSDGTLSCSAWGGVLNGSNMSACSEDYLAAVAPALTAAGSPEMSSYLGYLVTNLFLVFLVFPWIVATVALFITAVFKSIPFVLSPRWKPPQKLESSVWVIHGKRYDFSAWAERHPGGRKAIDLGRNRDCTGLFESYHVLADRSRLERTLKRFELPPEEVAQRTDIPALPPAISKGLTFSDPFMQDVKSLVREHFKGRSHHKKPAVGALLALLLVLEVILYYCIVTGSMVALVTLPFVAILLVMGVAHDASHFALSSRPWLNDVGSLVGSFFAFNRTCWYIQHVVQHHVYTNEEDDVDLYHFLPVMRTSRLTKWTSQFKVQLLTMFLVLPTSIGHLMFIVPIDLLSGQTDAITGKTRYYQCQNLQDYVARNSKSICLEVIASSMMIFTLVIAFGIWEGGKRLFIMWGLLSYLFIIVTQGAHLQAACQIGDEERSWAKRQVCTSVNFKPRSQFWNFVMGGLNAQSLHHVMPQVDSSHYADLYPRFKEVCDRHGVECQEVNNIMEFFWGYVRWIRELAEQDAPTKEVATTPEVADSGTL